MEADVLLCNCHRKADYGYAPFPNLRMLDDLPAAMPAEFLVLLEHGCNRWWDIAWKDSVTGLIDGPWLYVPDLHDAKPIAWCLLPPIGTTSDCA